MRVIDIGLVMRSKADLKRARELTEECSRAHRLEQLGDTTEEALFAMVKTYSVDETAELLGLSKETIYREIRKGALKAAKTGKTYRISRLDIDAWWKARGGGELFDEDRGNSNE
jgi:excisionase family DNA binding protein